MKLCGCTVITPSRHFGGLLTLTVNDKEKNVFSCVSSLTKFLVNGIQRSNVFLIYFSLSFYELFKCKLIQTISKI